MGRQGARDTTINVGGVVAVQALLIITGVALARGLGAADRGHLALIVLVSLAVFQLFSLGVPLSVTFALARDRRSGESVAAALRKLVAWQLPLMLAVQAILTAALVLDESRRVEAAALVCLVLTPGVVAHRYGLAALQGRERFVSYNVLLNLPLLMFAAVLGVLALADELTLVAAAAAFSGTSLVGGLITWAHARSQLSGAGSESVTTRWMLSFGARGMLGSTASPIETYRLDQAAVGLFLTPAALGQYVVAASLTNLPRFVAQSVGLVAFPRVAAERSHTRARRLMWRFFWVSIPLCAVVAGTLWFLSEPLVRLFFGDEFKSAAQIVRIMLLGTFLGGARRVLSEGARGAGHPTSSSVAEVAALVVLIPLLVVLTPAHGGEGAAWALTISSAVGLIVMLVAIQVVGRGPDPEVGAVEAPAQAEAAA